MKLIQIENRKFLVLIIVGILFGLGGLQSKGYINLNGEGEVSLFLIIIFILSLFIKLEVKNVRTSKR